MFLSALLPFYFYLFTFLYLLPFLSNAFERHVVRRFVRRAETYAYVARRANELTCERHCLEIRNGLVQGDCDNVCGLQRYHHVTLATRQRAHSARAEVGCEHAVECVRTPSALQVSKDYATHFLARQSFEFMLAEEAHAAQSGRVLAVAFVLINLLAAYLSSPFRDDHDAELRATLFALAYLRCYRFHRKWNLRDENHVRPASHARMQRNPTRVPPHNFQYHHAVVRFGSSVKAINRFGRNV